MSVVSSLMFAAMLARAVTLAIALVVPMVALPSAVRADVDDDDVDIEPDGWRGPRDGARVDLELDVDVAGGASPRGTPSIAEVLEAAYEAAGLDRDPTTSWIRRARVAGLIPWITVRTGWDANWHDDEPGVGRGRTFEVRATWRLDRLLFDGRELQVSSIDAARRRERRRLASRVIQAFFHWRRVTTLAARSSRFALAAEAATAELDALTDGWFSDRAKSGR